MIQFNKKEQKILNDKFKQLSFNEPNHKYYLNGKPIKYSVSGLIANFYEKFDFDDMVDMYANSRGLLPEQVASAWKGINDVSLDLGSNAHAFAEDYVRDDFDSSLLPENKKELGIVQFWNDISSDNLEILELEQIMCNLDESGYLFSGTPDITLRKKDNGHLIIMDWKTNKELFGYTYNKHLKEPFQYLEENNFNKYQLQLSFYQILLENAGYTVDDRIIIWLDEDKKKKKLYKTYRTEDFTKQLREWLQLKKQ